jgi:hypothetical protein
VDKNLVKLQYLATTRLLITDTGRHDKKCQY